MTFETVLMKLNRDKDLGYEGARYVALNTIAFLINKNELNQCVIEISSYCKENALKLFPFE